MLNFSFFLVLVEFENKPFDHNVLLAAFADWLNMFFVVVASFRMSGWIGDNGLLDLSFVYVYILL